LEELQEDTVRRKFGELIYRFLWRKGNRSSVAVVEGVRRKKKGERGERSRWGGGKILWALKEGLARPEKGQGKGKFQ